MIIKKDWLTIGEVSELTGVPIHTLRYWESEFSGYFSPIRTNGRQRRYDEEAVDRVKNIKTLLKEEKYSIAGAKQVLERTVINLEMEKSPLGRLGAYSALDNSENSQPTPAPTSTSNVPN
jgi:DNA-binding transcriptional MerR regulator